MMTKQHYHLSLKLFGIVCALILVPNMAYAYDLVCNTTNGTPESGDIFPGFGDCSMFSVYQPFSSLNCYFISILNAVMKRMYCGIQFQFSATLQVIMVMFVIVYAIMFMFGLSALTAKELVIRLLKLSLVWAFAMNASWGVGLAFYFLVGGIETMVTWVINVFFNNLGTYSFIGYLDYLIKTQLTQGLSNTGVKLAGFFGTMAVLMFPIFLLFVVFVMTVVAALTRTVVSYLIGVSAIAFLLALGPIFISCALFKSTYTFFDSWLRYLISFSLQIVLIFAAVALWLFVMSKFGNYLADLVNLIVPYKDLAHSEGSVAIFNNTWGICPGGATAASEAAGKCANGDWPQPPPVYTADKPFMSKVTLELITLGAVVYAFDALIRMMPNLARQLAGPAFAPQLMGGTGFGSIQMPGFTMAGQLKEQALFEAKSGIIKSFDSWRNGFRTGSAAGAGQAAGGGQGNNTQQVRNQMGGLAGGSTPP